MITIDQMKEADKIFDSELMNKVIADISHIMYDAAKDYLGYLAKEQPQTKQFVAPIKEMEYIAIARACTRLEDAIRKSIMTELQKNPDYHETMEAIKKHQQQNTN